MAQPAGSCWRRSPRTPSRRWRPARAEICAELVDRLAEQDGCDAAEEYAKHIPARVIAHLLGVPEEDGDLFRGWIQDSLEEGITDYEKAMRGFDGMSNYFREQVADAPRAAGGRRGARATTSSARCWTPRSTGSRSTTTT